MLVLARRPGESTLLGENIRVYVIEILDDRVRLGFEAPPDCTIIRDELLPKAKRKQINRHKPNATHRLTERQQQRR